MLRRNGPRIINDRGARMKKKIILILACLLTLSLFTACGGKQTETSGAAPGQTSTAAPGNNTSQAQDSASEESIARLFSKGKNLEIQYDFTAISPDGKVEGKQYIKGKQIRHEMSLEGQKYIWLVNFEKGEAYNYIPAEKIAMKMNFDEMRDMLQDPTDYLEDVDFQNASIIESATYEGIECKVVLNKDADGTETKLWIAEQYGIPLRVEETDSDGDKVIVEYKNIKAGSISDDLFVIPAGTEILSM